MGYIDFKVENFNSFQWYDESASNSLNFLASSYFWSEI